MKSTRSRVAPHSTRPVGLGSRWTRLLREPSSCSRVSLRFPEAFVDTIVINGGCIRSKCASERVRFRLLNGSQARFDHLNLFRNTAISGRSAVDSGPRSIYQVGTEGVIPSQGIDSRTTESRSHSILSTLRGSAMADGLVQPVLAPAERADVVIDFKRAPAGAIFKSGINDAAGTFPRRWPDDYSRAAPPTRFGGAPTTLPGREPNTRTLMNITVSAGSGR